MAEALLPHSTNEITSIEEKDREDEWVAFVVPWFYFEEKVGDYDFRKPRHRGNYSHENSSDPRMHF